MRPRDASLQRATKLCYTIAKLHFAQKMSVIAGTADFTLGGVSFSSSLAAFQTIALAWNIGHLPGTFGVEKGVHRFLMNRSRNNPTEFLQVAHRTDPKVVEFLRGQMLSWLRKVSHGYAEY
jgi:hypothetical protein